MTQPLLRVVGLHKRFGSRQVLADVSLDALPAEIVCVVGPAGAGKTTLLRCVHQLTPPDAGAIWLDGALCGVSRIGGWLYPLADRHVARQRRKAATMFQAFDLFTDKTVRANLLEGPVGVLRRRPAEVLAAVAAPLAQLGLTEVMDRFPHELLPGQRQCVALVRALAMQPRLLLLDEPTSALGPDLEQGLEQDLAKAVLALLRAWSRSGGAVLITTRSPALARVVADRVVLLDKGRVSAIGTPTTVLDRVAHPPGQAATN